MGGVTRPTKVIHFTAIEGGAPGGNVLFRCETCGHEMTWGITTHSVGHGGDYAVIDNLTTISEDQARKIMEEVRNTSLTYLLLEVTDRDDIPAFECAECNEKLTALGLGKHLEVHGAKTYRIDSLRLISPYLVAIGEKFEEIRQLIGKNFLNSRERSLALTDLERTELWLTKCQEVESVPYTP